MALLNKDSDMTATKLLNKGREQGFQLREPTPLVSPFWKTTFTPSSSEVMFREIRNSINGVSRISTSQPCCRFADIVHSGDDSHLLFFHMVTFFAIGANDVLGDMKWFLETVASLLKIPLSKMLFSVFSHPSKYVSEPLFEDFGLSLLERCGISKANCIERKGLANYQLDLHKYETGNQIKVNGPKIEIFCKNGANQYIEIGTLILSTGMMSERADSVIPKTLSMVVGPERMSIIANSKKSIWEITPYADLMLLCQRNFLAESEILLAEQEVRMVLDICVALLQLSKLAPELMPSEKGIGHHLRRLIREQTRLLEYLGIPLYELWDTIFLYMNNHSNKQSYDKEVIFKWFNLYEQPYANK